MNREGIKTTYNSVNFRSRLEAKWAAFFDLLGWNWEYEPFDLNGWIPDFILIGKNQSTLVEVKPFTHLREFATTIAKVKKAAKGTDHEDSEVLYLGCTLSNDDGWDTPILGWLDDGLSTELAGFNHEDSHGYGFFHTLNSFADRITGRYDGDGHLKFPSFDEMQSLFRRAGSEVQWEK